jgi:hypothetical protein
LEKIGEKVEELAEMVREGKRQLGIVRNEQRYLGTRGRIRHGTVIKDLSYSLKW